MNEPRKYHILFLTRWYPNKTDNQLGVFIKKHALSVSGLCNVSLLYVQPISTLKTNREVDIKSENGLNEIIIYYKGTSYSFINFWRYISNHFYGYRLIREKFSKPDLIHENVLYGLGIICWMMSVWFRFPYIVSEHWHGFADGQFSRKNIIFKTAVRYAAFKAKAVTSVSNYLKKGMIESGIHKTIQVIPNIVEVISIPLKKENRTAIRFLTVADLLDSVKNISSVIQVFSEIVAEHPDKKIEYHIIGGGIDENYLKHLATEKSLLNKVFFFHGQQTNEFVLKFLNETDFAIVNSRKETFSVFAAEALMCGKPIICTRCGGPEEFLNDSNSLLIDVDNQNQLKQNIELLLNDEPKFDMQIISSELKEKFSSAKIGAQFFEIYKSILH